MRRLSPLLKSLALVLALVLLTVRIGSFSHETFVAPIQSYISDLAFFAAEDAKPRLPFHKPSRALVAEVLACDGIQSLLVHFPPVFELTPLTTFQTLPEVYPDIFIPPEAAV